MKLVRHEPYSNWYRHLCEWAKSIYFNVELCLKKVQMNILFHTSKIGCKRNFIRTSTSTNINLLSFYLRCVRDERLH